MNPQGLVDIKSGLSCPLRSLRIQSAFIDRFGTVKVIQEYENVGKTSIEAVFTFPKDDQAAITGLKVTTNNKTLIGQIEASDEAQEKYSDAIAEGKGAYLLSQKRSDIVTLYIGSLLPKQKVEVEISCVTEAQWEGESLRITFPTTIAPRYTPQQLQHDEDHQLNPVYHADDTKLPYDFSIESSIKLTHDTISSFESPTHKFSDREISADRTQVNAKIVAKKGDIVADRDVVLIVHSNKRSLLKEPIMIDEVDENGHHVLYLSFIPKIICNKISEKKAQEIVFVIDRSGSMEGQQMERAKEALQLFLRSLPECFFEIISFGSSCQKLFGSPTQYSNQTLAQATEKVQKFQANLGGTELLNPLQEICKTSPRSGKRIIFVLTGTHLLIRNNDLMRYPDGQVSNTRQVVDLVKKNSRTTTVFSLGIGSSVSKELVNGLAEAGNGYAEYATAHERLQPKIIRLLKRALENVSVSIDWHSRTVDQYPERISSISDGDPLHVMAFVDDGYLRSNRTIAIKIKCDENEFSIPFDLTQLKTIRDTRIHQLFAKKKADSISADATKDQIRAVQNLCKEYKVLSNLTSFILVENRKMAAGATPELVNVPLARPQPPKLSAQQLVTSGSVALRGTFSNQYKATIGADFAYCGVQLADREVHAQIWDPSGGERFGQLSSVFMRGASGVILMYDVNSKASLDNLKTWIEAARSHNGEDVPMVVAGNKIDIANRKVSTIEGQKFADSYGIPFFEISVKDTTNLAELVKLIIASVLLKDPNVRPIKVILLGDSAVGKTAFSRRLAGSTVDLSDFDSGNGSTSSQVRTDTSASTSLLGKVWGGFQSVVGFFGGSKSRSTSNAVQVQTPSISVQMPPQKRKVDLNPIIMAQNAEGAWNINASESIKLFGSDLTQAPQGVKNDAWMTMICIAYLSVVCSQHKSEWELIVQKAENWLKSVGANRNEWNQRAKQLIQQSM